MQPLDTPPDPLPINGIDAPQVHPPDRQSEPLPVNCIDIQDRGKRLDLKIMDSLLKGNDQAAKNITTVTKFITETDVKRNTSASRPSPQV